MNKAKKRNKARKINLFLFSFIILLIICLGFFLVYKKNNDSYLNNNVFLDKENVNLSNSDTKIQSEDNNSLPANYNNSSNINNSSSNSSSNKSKSYSGGGGGGGGSSSSTNPSAPSTTPAIPEYNNTQNENSSYPPRNNITVTLFWVGEKASEDNDFISNKQSAWDDKWLEHSVNENPFYFALPYNDFENGKRKSDVYNIVYWADEKNWGALESMCKNQWIKITKGNKTAYAQWEDVGPFEEDDFNYIFGNSTPKNKENNHAGLDVSPAVHDFLGLEDIDKVNWQFVNFSEVPEGSWKTKITTSQIFWN